MVGRGNKVPSTFSTSSNARKKRKTTSAKRDDDADGVELVVEESSSSPNNPLMIELILGRILSFLTDSSDLLRARLVSKTCWFTLATEEVRGRKSVFPMLGNPDLPEQDRVLDEGCVSRFLDLMTPCPLIPIQQLSFRLDPLVIGPRLFLRLLKFIAPWVKSLRISPWDSLDVDLEVNSPLDAEKMKMVATWTNDVLDAFSGLQFPCLETLELGEPNTHIFNQHQSLSMTLMMVLKRLVQGAVSLRNFQYNVNFFGNDNDIMKDSERLATSSITQALPSSSLRTLGFDDDCKVDYSALSKLDLKLESFLGKGEEESEEEFRKFMKSQKTTLRTFNVRQLEEIYDDDDDFPQLNFVSSLRMDFTPTSTLECLQAFPALSHLEIDIDLCRGAVPRSSPIRDLDRLPVHPSVTSLTVRDIQAEGMNFVRRFPLLAHVLPKLSSLDLDLNLDCQGDLDEKLLTGVFTHLSNLHRLHLRFGGVTLVGVREGLQSALSGIPHHICALTEGYSLSDEVGFHAISAIASRDPASKPGMANLKDLQLLEISSLSFESILTSLTFQTVFRQMKSLREIRLFGGTQGCQPVLEALKGAGILLRVYPAKAE